MSNTQQGALLPEDEPSRTLPTESAAKRSPKQGVKLAATSFQDFSDGVSKASVLYHESRNVARLLLTAALEMRVVDGEENEMPSDEHIERMLGAVPEFGPLSERRVLWDCLAFLQHAARLIDLIRALDIPSVFAVRNKFVSADQIALFKEIKAISAVNLPLDTPEMVSFSRALSKAADYAIQIRISKGVL